LGGESDGRSYHADLALTFVGLLLVAIGLFAAASIEIVIVGVVCLIATGLFGVWVGRRERP
jgi:hypothetical protein